MGSWLDHDNSNEYLQAGDARETCQGSEGSPARRVRTEF
jgi:hypothetical protein